MENANEAGHTRHRWSDACIQHSSLGSRTSYCRCLQDYVNEFVRYKVTRLDNIAIWLSGFHNGKNNNTIVDTQELTTNAKKLRDYCVRNREVLVMQAVETVLQADK